MRINSFMRAKKAVRSFSRERERVGVRALTFQGLSHCGNTFSRSAGISGGSA